MQRCLASSLRFITTKVASKPAVPLPKAAAATRKVYKVKAGDLLAAQYKRTLAPYSLPSHLPKPRLTNSTPAVDAFVQKVQASSVPFTAFDMEWNMSTQRGVERRTALIQIAHPQLGILLYSVPRGEHDSLPQSLQDYIGTPDIYKMGVQIRGDGQKLRRDWPKMDPLNGQIELNIVARLVDPEEWIAYTAPLASMQRLAATYLGRYLDKGLVRRSNWEGMQLGEESLSYASKDVQATLDIYASLEKMASSKGIAIDLSKLAGKVELPGKAPSVTPRMVEAWDLVFADVTVETKKIEEASSRMNIKERSVYLYILAAVQRDARRLQMASRRQAGSFAALAETHFHGFQPHHIASTLALIKTRAAEPDEAQQDMEAS